MVVPIPKEPQAQPLRRKQNGELADLRQTEATDQRSRQTSAYCQDRYRHQRNLERKQDRQQGNQDVKLRHHG